MKKKTALAVLFVACSALGQAQMTLLGVGGPAVHAGSNTIAFDATANSGAVTGASQCLYNHTIAGANRLLVIGTSAIGVTGPNVTGVLVNGSATGVTFIRRDVHTQFSQQATELWYMIAPPTGTVSIQVNFDISISEGACGSISLTGVNQTTALDANTGAQGTTASATATITTVAANCWILGTTYYDDNGTPPSLDVGTSRWSVNTGARYGAGMNYGPKATAGSQAISWTVISDRWTVSLASFKPL